MLKEYLANTRIETTNSYILASYDTRLPEKFQVFSGKNILCDGIRYIGAGCTFFAIGQITMDALREIPDNTTMIAGTYIRIPNVQKIGINCKIICKEILKNV
jgi:hypothetical protein